MKKYYQLKNSFFLLLFLFFSIVSTAQVDLTASVDEIPPLTNGQTFNYSIESVGPAWVGVRIKLIYDPAVIQLNSLTPIYAFNIPLVNDTATPGLIKYEGIDTSPISPDITIFTIEFEVLDDTQTITVAHNYDPSDGTVVTNNSAVDILGVANDIILAPLGTEDNVFKNSLSIYPNPAKDNLNIKLNRSSFGLQSIKINSIDGKLVKRLNVEGSYSEAIRVDISDLRSAMYFMTIISEDDRQANYKFVVK